MNYAVMLVHSNCKQVRIEYVKRPLLEKVRYCSPFQIQTAVNSALLLNCTRSAVALLNSSGDCSHIFRHRVNKTTLNHQTLREQNESGEYTVGSPYMNYITLLLHTEYMNNKTVLQQILLSHGGKLQLLSVRIFSNIKGKNITHETTVPDVTLSF